MPEAGSRLETSALAVVVRIARRQLRAANAAWERLRKGDDDAALHDFRVAIRRLRSTLQAYRPQLRAVLRPKDRHRLRRLADATGPARDAEMQIARLRALRNDLDPEAHVLVSRLSRQLRRRMRAAYAKACAEIETLHPRTARALKKRLRQAAIPVDGLPFRLVIGRFITAHTDDLRPLLEHLAPLEAPRKLHQARIEAKRLRYVLEPVQRSVPGSTVLIHRLERVQDLLGELHDFQILEQTLVATHATGTSARALLGLTRLVRERQRRVYAEVTRSFVGSHAPTVLGPLDLLTARLGGGRRPALPLRPARTSPPQAVVSHRRRW